MKQLSDCFGTNRRGPRIFRLSFICALSATRAAADIASADRAAGRTFLGHVETLRQRAKIPGLAVVEAAVERSPFVTALLADVPR